jgi:hypothetical protein
MTKKEMEAAWKTRYEEYCRTYPSLYDPDQPSLPFGGVHEWQTTADEKDKLAYLKVRVGLQ